MSGLVTLLEENASSILTCVHCGLCLPACPTYRELGNENDSPRGRVYLMRAAAESRIEASEVFVEHIDLCLGCRACETVCPSGVPYGQLLEAARTEVVEARKKRGSFAEFMVRVLLTQVFSRPGLLRFAFRLALLFRDSGLARLSFEAGLLSQQLRFAVALLLASAPSSRPSTAKAGRASAEIPDGSKHASVGLLTGCVMEGLFGHVNRATERVLTANGFELKSVPDQVCCGALHAHAGYRATALDLARKNIEAFLSSGCERVVANAAGCGAALKEYAEWLSNDSAFVGKAKLFSSMVRDFSELLAESPLTRPEFEVARTIAYDAPCHLIHGQRIAEQPLAILRSVPGLSLRPLQGAETCCGGAGIYNLQHPELSKGILQKKLDAIAASGAEIIATANPGCIMQIGAGLLMEESSIPVVHPAEILELAYFGSED